MVGSAGLGWVGLGIAAALAVMVGLLVAFPLWLSVNAFNRPRFLVPPAHRDERGWLTEWRVRRRRAAPMFPTPTTW